MFLFLCTVFRTLLDFCIENSEIVRLWFGRLFRSAGDGLLLDAIENCVLYSDEEEEKEEKDDVVDSVGDTDILR